MPKNKRSSSPLFKKIGEKVAHARIEILKTTQKEFAARLGYKDPSLLSQIENGHKSPLQKLPQIARITGMKISWFFEDEAEKDAKEWKAKQYDYCRQVMDEVFGIGLKKRHTEMTRDEHHRELERELDRFGIVEPELKVFCKIWPFLDHKEKQNALQFVRVFIAERIPPSTKF